MQEKSCFPPVSQKAGKESDVLDLPVDRRNPVRFQKLVGLTEVATAKKASVSRQRTRMRCLQNKMLRIVQHGFFCARRTSPEQEDDRSVLLIQDPDHCISKLFPADPAVRIGLMRPYRQNSIQQQYALLRPFFQIAIVRNAASQIVLQLLIDVDK